MRREKVVLDMYPCALSDITHYGIGKLRIKIILMIEQQQNKIASFYNIIMVIVLVLLDHLCRKWMYVQWNIYRVVTSQHSRIVHLVSGGERLRGNQIRVQRVRLHKVADEL